MNTNEYSRMQKSYYEGPHNAHDDIVGNYAWHEEFPYETLLLHQDGDMRRPIFPSFSGLRALDFGCGPGRMVARMSRLFAQVDGVDISRKLIDLAQKNCPQSQFWATDGSDLGGVPLDAYDFIYSTIAVQHIAVHSIREKIFREMRKRLRPGGKITLQMAYSDTYPYVRSKHRYSLGPVRVDLLKKLSHHARWEDDKISASSTNGQCDVTITRNDLSLVEDEISQIFGSCKLWLYDVASRFDPPAGARHFPTNYWPTHWIFIHGGDGVGAV